MSIDVKCNSCSSKYSVSDRLAGGSVKCSKCHAPIHVPIVPRQPTPAPAATAAEAADLAFEYTPHLSPPGAASAATQPVATQPVAAPPAAGEPAASTSVAEPPQSEEPQAEEPAHEAAAEARPRRQFNFSWLRFLAPRPAPLPGAAPAGGFRVRRYWTGELAPALWVLSLLGAAYLVFAAVRQLWSLGGLPAGVQQFAFWAGVAQIAGVAALVIVVRIALETISVLFEIAETLREVRDDLRSRS